MEVVNFTRSEVTGMLATAVDLYKARPGRVEFVDVPEFGYAVVEGQGDPSGAAFAAAIRALFTVSYRAHFLAKRKFGDAPHVMPLEALWWTAGGGPLELSDRDIDRPEWRWQAMIMQPAPIDDAVVAAAIAAAGAKAGPALAELRFVRWTEGHCAQLLHVGPYSTEGRSVATLHAAIRAAGYRPCGRHHEIYLGDPRRSAPERLRTILRQPMDS
jgi:hypothetical protein